jgi:uncharacterized protein YukE
MFKTTEMKKILLFLILALSVNVFAQSQRAEYLNQGQKAAFNEKAYAQLEAAGLKTPAMYSKLKHAGTSNFQSFDLNSSVQIVDSSYHWHWDVNDGAWKADLKFINIVYNNNNKISDLGQKWTGSTWTDTIRNTYSYDAGNFPAKVVSKSWDGGTWTNSLQITYTYDAKHNITSVAWQAWKNSIWSNYMEFTSMYDANNNLINEALLFGSGTNWINFSQSNYTYDANNNKLSQIDESWNGTSWDESQKYIWTYNAGNNMTSELIQSWNGSSWDDFTKSQFNYNASNKLETELAQMWDGSVWMDYSKTTCTYDASTNLLNELVLNWDGSEWVNGGQHIYTYDTHKNQTSDLKQFWNGSSWYNTSQHLFTFDANNFEKASSTKNWNADGTAVSGGDSTRYYYPTVVIGISEPMEAGINVYPNPSQGKFAISSNSSINSVEVYDLSGKRIYTDFNIHQQPSTEIDLAGFAKGIYLMKIYKGTMIYSKKVVIQ